MSGRIKAVILDQGGVLHRPIRHESKADIAARLMGLDQPAALAFLIARLREGLKRGHISNDEFFAEINRQFPQAPRPLTDALWDESFALLRPEPVAYAFAERCRRAGLVVGLLSNITPGTAKRLRDNGAYDGFDPLVLSCEVGCAKPDPEIFAIVERHLPDIKPEEFLMIDDKDKCTDAARRRGWQAVKVINSEQMVRDASKLIGF